MENYCLIPLGVIIFIALALLLLSRLAIVDFTEEEVLEAVTDWKSFVEIKILIEAKKEFKNISGLKLEQVLNKLECERKITFQNFTLSREEAQKLNMRAIPKYRIVSKQSQVSNN